MARRMGRRGRGTRWATDRRTGGGEAAGRQRVTAVTHCPQWGHAPMREWRKGGQCRVRRGEV
jgi:hypothetical protein